LTAKILASADGTYGSLGVGANEAFRFGSDNSGQLASFRNKLINGGMQIAQRGTVPLSANVSVFGGPDRYQTYIQAATVSGGAIYQTSSSDSVSGYAYLADPINATGVTAFEVLQNIESANSVGLSGKKLTVSVKTYQSIGASCDIRLRVSSPSIKDDWLSSITSIDSDIASVPSNVVTPIKRTLDLSTLNASNGLRVSVIWTMSSRTLTNAGFWLADFQAEEGSIATPFEQRPIGLELSLCQRYYEVLTVGWLGNASAGAQPCGLTQSFRANKRAVPTIAALSNKDAVNVSGSTPNFSQIEADSFRGYRESAAAGGVIWASVVAASAEL
jgi:hypothetical protein